jgi:hypothetical protein
MGSDSVPELIYKNWGVDPGATIDDVPQWIKREFLSFYLMPNWLSQIEWDQLLTWSNPKCLVITVDDLLHNIESTISKIKEFCNLKFERPVSDLLPYHQINLQKQKYLNEDRLCAEIVHSVINGLDFNWQPLSLFSESWVQWELRNQGIEIKCYGIDNFPTNSLHLKELSYFV